MTQLPLFSYHLLHPRYWFTWFGIAVLYLIVLLPYPLLYYMGNGLGQLSMRFLTRRVAIARRNIELCFPSLSVKEREKLVRQNFKSVGMGLIETGMAWFWPDWRIKKWFTITGYEHMQATRDKQCGILVIGIHFLTLELGARIFGMLNPGIGVYRPNDNPLLDWLQTRGRMRSNKRMIDRSDLKGMIRALKANEIIWYAPDHDYGPKSSVFAPFFAVEKAATTKGSYMLMRSASPVVVPFVPRRRPHAKGYELIILPAIDTVSHDDQLMAATQMNQIVEQAIRIAPEQYMWLHRRFKTRPPGEKSLY